MILADTSIWVDYFRRPNLRFVEHLRQGLILYHPFVIGELALGGVTSEMPVVQTMKRLFAATVATHEEVLALIEGQGLIGSGIGYVDAHLLASTCLSKATRLWTLDKKLHTVAERLGIAL